MLNQLTVQMHTKSVYVQTSVHKVTKSSLLFRMIQAMFKNIKKLVKRRPNCKPHYEKFPYLSSPGP